MSKQMTVDEAAKIVQKSIVQNPGLQLTPGEVCYYAGEATAAIAKNMNIGSTYSGSG